jgi:hypothetical protein
VGDIAAVLFASAHAFYGMARRSFRHDRLMEAIGGEERHGDRGSWN